MKNNSEYDVDDINSGEGNPEQPLDTIVEDTSTNIIPVVHTANITAQEISYKDALLQIIKMAIPFSANNFSLTISNYLKFLMISRLDTSTLAATSVAFTIKNVITGLEGSLLRPILPMVARNYSARNYEIAGSILQQAWLLGTLESVPVIILLTQSQPIISKIWGNEMLGSVAASYLIPLSFSLPFERWKDVDIAFLSAVGKQQYTVWFTIIPKGIGVFLSYGIILGNFGLPKLGLAGAAYANLVEALISVSMLKAYFYLSDGFTEYGIFNFRCRSTFTQLRTILKLGFPSAVFSVIQFPIDILINIMISWLGPSRLIIDQLAWQNLSYLFPIIDATSRATSISVAQNAGSHNYVNMRRFATIGLAPNFTLALLETFILVAFSTQVVNFFVHDKTDFDVSNSLIKFAFLLAGMNACLMATSSNAIGNLQAIYDVYIPTGIEVLNAFVVTLPLCYLLSQVIDADIIGIYFAQLIGRFILNLGWQLRWQQKSSNLQLTDENRTDTFQQSDLEDLVLNRETEESNEAVNDRNTWFSARFSSPLTYFFKSLLPNNARNTYSPTATQHRLA